jgi:hypothetical protein
MARGERSLPGRVCRLSQTKVFVAWRKQGQKLAEAHKMGLSPLIYYLCKGRNNTIAGR